MLVYRLTKKKYKDNLSGKGAAIRGARWNSVGMEIIYTASSRALAMSEVAVHITYEMMPADYWMIEIDIPDNLLISSCETLPDNWNAFPYTDTSKKIGDKFIIDNAYVALRVPSAVVQKEWNILINPLHTDFKKVKTVESEPFVFDRRLFKPLK